MRPIRRHKKAKPDHVKIKLGGFFMKKLDRFVLAFLLANACCLAVPPARALSEKEVAAINKSLRGAPAAELPVKSAVIVARAVASEKEATAVAVVRAAIAEKPAAAVAVVSSVVKAAPAT